jgi:hypothetical protein
VLSHDAGFLTELSMSPTTNPLRTAMSRALNN